MVYSEGVPTADGNLESTRNWLSITGLGLHLAYSWLQPKRFSPWNFHKLSGLTGIHIDSPFKQMRR